MRSRRFVSMTLLLFAYTFAAGVAAANTTVDPANTTVLRVGTSGDYAPFSIASDTTAGYEGFDIDVANAYALDRGLTVEFVRFRWPNLISNLTDGRFDVAMSGVTVRPERSAVGCFTTPVAETGALVITRGPERFKNLEDLNRRQIRIGVNAGGHLEQVAANRFPKATRVIISENAAVRKALLKEQLDAALTDTLEAPRWLAETEGLGVMGPFTRDRVAYLVAADHAQLAADLGAWILDREADGTLAELRARHFDRLGSPRLPTPLGALLAATAEQLSLMPLVGLAKHEAGLPLEVPERESYALDAAVESALMAERHPAAKPPAASAIRGLFRALMEAAKEVQWGAARDPEFDPPDSVPDFDRELRPALLRIRDRIGVLLVKLPVGLEVKQVLADVRRDVQVPYLSEASQSALANSIAAVSAAMNDSPATEAPTSSPAPDRSGA